MGFDDDCHFLGFAVTRLSDGRHLIDCNWAARTSAGLLHMTTPLHECPYRGGGYGDGDPVPARPPDPPPIRVASAERDPADN